MATKPRGRAHEPWFEVVGGAVAGRSDRGVDMSLLRSELSSTYDRLAAMQQDDTWWRGVLTALGYEFVTPEFLKAPSRQEWLAEGPTREGLLRVAQSRALGRPDDSATIRRLIASYESRTGEADYFARGAIEVVLSVLMAGLKARLKSGHAVAQAGLIHLRADSEKTLELSESLLHKQLEIEQDDG